MRKAALLPVTLIRQTAGQIVTPVAAVILAFIVAGILVILAGGSPIKAYSSLFSGSLGSGFGLGLSLIEAAPLIFTGLAFAFAFRCGVYNVGAEGQLYVGALFSTMVALVDFEIPIFVHLPLVIFAGIIGGSLWALVPAILKARYEINEIISTIMMNYIAFWIVDALVSGPIRDRGAPMSQSYLLAPNARLPIISPDVRFHAGIIVAIIIAAILSVILWRTTLGYRVRLVGSSMAAAKHAGINVRRTMVWAMLISGGVAGLAGTSAVAGVFYRLNSFISPGYGYDGIAVALLGSAQPAGIVFAGIFVGMLRAGGQSMAWQANIHYTFVWIIQALAILFVIGRHGLRRPQWLRRPIWLRRRREVPEVAA